MSMRAHGWTARMLPALFALALLCHDRAAAQFFGHNFPADLGVNSGSQPPPGAYLSLLVPYYHASTIRLEGGATVPNPGRGVTRAAGSSPFDAVYHALDAR